MYRRVPPRISHYKDGRPTRLVFTPNRLRGEDRLSAILAEYCNGPEDALKPEKPNDGVVQISIEDLNRRGFAVRFELGDHAGHVHIYGDFADPVCDELAEIAEWARRPRTP